jgi:hypothetical protein
MAEENTNTEEQNSNTLLGGSDQNSENQTSEGSENENNQGSDQQNEEQNNNDNSNTQEITYEDFTLPDGVVLDQEFSGEFSNLAKEFGLDQEKAQKAIDLIVKKVQSDGTRTQQTIEKAIQDNMTAERTKWIDEMQNDSEYGGPKFEETKTRALRTLRSYMESTGDSKITEFLDNTGVGDSPHLIKLLAFIDKKYGEDSHVAGQPSGEISDSELFYGKNK